MSNLKTICFVNNLNNVQLLIYPSRLTFDLIMYQPRGGWTFDFVWAKKESLKVRKYQAALLKIREEFEPKFAEMSATEGNDNVSHLKCGYLTNEQLIIACFTKGSVEWTSRTDGKAPADNLFVKFSYICTKPHQPQGDDHGSWMLLWNPKKANITHNLHARCAPNLFKELSNSIQRQLVKEFKDNFILEWANGLSGYDNGMGGVNMAAIHRMFRQMRVADQWQDSERCGHHLPWGYCEDCDGDVLDMYG